MKRERLNKQKVTSVRLTEKELDKARKLARLKEMRLAEYLRSAIIRRNREELAQACL